MKFSLKSDSGAKSYTLPLIVVIIVGIVLIVVGAYLLNGSIVVDVKPRFWQGLGLVLSGLAIIGILIYLIPVRGRREEKKEKMEEKKEEEPKEITVEEPKEETIEEEKEEEKES